MRPGGHHSSISYCQSAYYVPDSGSKYAFYYEIVKIALISRYYYYLCFIDVETEMQRGQEACLKLLVTGEAEV